jgi:hypothetical protein
MLKNLSMKRISKTAVVAFGLGTAMIASAAPATTVADLWSSISFADIISAVFGIGTLIIGVDLAIIGYKRVRTLVKGAVA